MEFKKRFTLKTEMYSRKTYHNLDILILKYRSEIIPKYVIKKDKILNN